MLMPSISVGDLLVGSAAWSQSHGLTLSIGHGPTGWTAAILDRERRAVVEAVSPNLHDALVELYTAAQTARGIAA
jgi:hypothetical protein